MVFPNELLLKVQQSEMFKVLYYEKKMCSFCSHTSTDLFTAGAPRGKLVLVASHAVVLVLVGYEGLGANRLLAAVTDEAALVPC